MPKPPPSLPDDYRSATDRTAWILTRRGPKLPVDPFRPYAYFLEEETGPDGLPWATATLLLSNRECPWHCLMCDLWRQTTDKPVPAGAVAEQVRWGLEQLPGCRQVKLYNAGSFFDRKAIPPADYAEIARLCRGMERVVVECHPALVGSATEQFQQMLLPCTLEVAMGLETIHPQVLPLLNKGMTGESFRRAAQHLASCRIPTRAFILVRPPWLSEAEGIEWACRTLEFAWECGVETCVVIPTRRGNGALEALESAGEFSEPDLTSLEEVLEFGLSHRRGRVFADLWDLERFARCPTCFAARKARLEAMNQRQQAQPRVSCPSCGP